MFLILFPSLSETDSGLGYLNSGKMLMNSFFVILHYGFFVQCHSTPTHRQVKPKLATILFVKLARCTYDLQCSEMETGIIIHIVHRILAGVSAREMGRYNRRC